MKRILNILTATLIAFTFAACEQLQENGNGNGGNDNSQTSELKFTLTKGAITGTDAKITVSHNGKSTDSWYWICVEKTDDIDGAISDVLDNNKYQRSHHKAFNDFDVLIDELQASTEYTFIVFGLSSDMKVYGTVASLDFKTKFAEMTVNPNWTVSYGGSYEDPDTGEMLAEHTIAVESTDNQRYFVAAFKKDAVDWYDDVTFLAEYKIEYLYYYVIEKGESIIDYTYTTSQLVAYDMEPGDWYAYAFGINDDGELTGIYAQSELYTIKEEDPTPEYQSWIGDWTFTGANDVAFDVTIAKDINNMYLTMYGWENLEDEWTEVTGITLYWDKIENDWLIQNEYYHEDDWGANVGLGVLGLFGCDEENIYLYSMPLPICYSETDEDGTKTCKGATLTFSDGDINMLYMQYAIAPYDENAYIGVISDVTEWPEFPITITPRTSGGTGNPETQIKAASVQNKLKFNKKAINAGKDFKNTRKSFDRMAVR